MDQSNINLSFHVDQQEIQNLKYFIFKMKKFPIDFDKLKKNSNYFYRNRKEFKQVDSINILDEFDNELIDISEDAIQAFVASCQNEPCQIHLSDVIPLQYLSYKYEFPRLITITDKFIQEHSDKLVFESILYKLSLRPNNETFSIPSEFFDTKNEEEIICDHLNEYIQNDQMHLLPVPVLHRIFSNCHSKSENKLRENPNELIEFLFKCLDKYGKDASVLFSFVDFENQTIGVVNKLIQNYSNVFDFNFINSTLLKTTIQLTNEVAKIKEEHSNFILQMKQWQDENEAKRNKILDDEIKKMKKEEEKRKNEFLKIKDDEERRVRLFEEEKEKMKKEEEKRKNEFFKMKEDEERRIKIFEDEMTKMKKEEENRKNEFLKMKEDEEKRIKIFEDEMTKMKNEEIKRKKKLDEEKKKIKEKEEEEAMKKKEKQLQNENIKEFVHKNGNEFNGIMRYLTKQTGGNIHDNKTIEITTNANYTSDHPKNLVDYEENSEYNSGTPNFEPKICFDFKDRGIQLSNYSIKSYGSAAGDGIKTSNASGHLRNWVIEVSNDKQTWETIDRHNNDSTLNGSDIVATFNICPKQTNFYRYIQLRSTGYSWYGRNRYDIFFYFIEFYGKLKETKSHQ